jgi:hypothetical protein
VGEGRWLRYLLALLAFGHCLIPLYGVGRNKEFPLAFLSRLIEFTCPVGQFVMISRISGGGKLILLLVLLLLCPRLLYHRLPAPTSIPRLLCGWFLCPRLESELFLRADVIHPSREFGTDRESCRKIWVLWFIAGMFVQLPAGPSRTHGYVFGKLGWH